MIKVRSRGWLAAAFAVAYLTCPMIEPEPNGPDPVMHWWLAAVDLGSAVAIVIAVVALAVGARAAANLGVLAGIGMCVETVLCPGSGHHLIGWWTGVQAALSLFVLGTSIGLVCIQTDAAAKTIPMGDRERQVSTSADLVLSEAQASAAADSRAKSAHGATAKTLR